MVNAAVAAGVEETAAEAGNNRFLLRRFGMARRWGTSLAALAGKAATVVAASAGSLNWNWMRRNCSMKMNWNRRTNSNSMA